MTSTSNHSGPDTWWWWLRSPRSGMAMVIVSALSHEKLPLMTSHDCVTIIRAAATPAIGWGRKRANGSTSWAAWLAVTSTRWAHMGRWWNHQLNGPGSGWVSWWYL